MDALELKLEYRVFMRMLPEILTGRINLLSYLFYFSGGSIFNKELIPIILCYSHFALTFCRGHTVAAVCNSFQLSKDCGFKVQILFFILLRETSYVSHMPITFNSQ
jgi:hypothetical protein